MQKQSIFRQSLRSSGALLAALAVLLMPAQAQVDPQDPSADDLTTIEIQCSPAVVNLNSRAGGNWMTVHTDLPWDAAIAKEDVTLNGLTAAVIKPDDCGDLVAKFLLSDLKPLITAPSTDLTLTVVMMDGVVYEGFDTVRVIQPPKTTPGKNARQNKPSAEQPRRVGKPQK